MLLRFICAAWLPLLLLGSASAQTRTAAAEGLIAFQRDPRGGISVVPTTGGRPRQISVRHGAPWYFRRGHPPVWSPDGRWIAIVNSRHVPAGHDCLTDDDFSCPSEIYVIRPDGTGERQVTPPANLTWNPVWSPDSRRSPLPALMVCLAS